MGAKGLVTKAFDYSVVPAETKGKLIAIAGQIKRGREHYNKSVLELGESIAVAHDLLANNKNGTFGKWVESEAGLEERSAYNYMNAWKAFRYSENISGYAPSAMYLLGAPEAPKEAVKEAEKLAKKGEKVTVAKAKEILDKLREIHKKVGGTKTTQATPPKSEAVPQVQQQQTEPENAFECPPGQHTFDDDGGCTKCNVQREVVERSPEPEEPPAAKLFAKLLEDIRQAVKGCDAVHNATGKQHGRFHEAVMNSLDIAGQEAQKWRRACK